MSILNTFCKSDIGKVRSHNEDSAEVFVNKNNDILAIIADGVGGHRAGDVASRMVIEYFSDIWENTSFQTPLETEQWLDKNVREVNTRIFTYSKENVEECEGMGTTLVALIATKEFITVAHIGDSRCYHFDGDMKQITEDHSLVNELLKFGQINEEDAKTHPRKNVILRALGTDEKIELDIKSLECENNSIFLLCSDGLSDKISDLEMDKVLHRDSSLNAKGEILINLANEYGGEDNISVILVEYPVSISKGGEI